MEQKQVYKYFSHFEYEKYLPDSDFMLNIEKYLPYFNFIVNREANFSDLTFMVNIEGETETQKEFEFKKPNTAQLLEHKHNYITTNQDKIIELENILEVKGSKNIGAKKEAISGFAFVGTIVFFC